MNDIEFEKIRKERRTIANIIFAIFIIAFILSLLSVSLENVPLSIRFNLSLIAFLLFLIAVIGMTLD